MIKVDAGSLRLTIRNIRNVGISEQKAAQSAVRAAGAVLLSAVRANALITDHSLRDLARLDHPYADRHGSIRIHGGGDRNAIANPTSVVHKQTGTFLRSLKGRPGTVVGGPTYRVFADVSVAPHAAYVIQGTRVMLQRDLIWDTAIAKGTRKAMMRTIVAVLGKGLRTQAGIRFGEATRPALPGGALEG